MRRIRRSTAACAERSPRQAWRRDQSHAILHFILTDSLTLNALMILVAGPYRSGTNDDPVLIAKNVTAMTEAALQLFRAGHLPVLGEWYALPLIEHAGSTRTGDAIFNEIFHPVARRLVAKCDGCLRIGGPSSGADDMVSLARQHGRAVYFSLDEIPAAR